MGLRCIDQNYTIDTRDLIIPSTGSGYVVRLVSSSVRVGDVLALYAGAGYISPPRPRQLGLLQVTDAVIGTFFFGIFIP